ncbi:MAG TPA: BrnT family toxin [bacterium]|nr:BrnT family toxin [bacterium]HPN46082.1 BrnT family toxin [bacterium]
MLFEWDQKKAQQNLIKHGVTFEEARTAFRDDMSITISDPLHSEDEERFILLGYSEKNRLIVVVHTDRQNQIRIISARRASKNERIQYEKRK